jgi:hypothetical protein
MNNVRKISPDNVAIFESSNETSLFVDNTENILNVATILIQSVRMKLLIFVSGHIYFGLFVSYYHSNLYQISRRILQAFLQFCKFPSNILHRLSR